MHTGRLIKGIGGFYYVDIKGEIFECKARGIFRKENITPVIGDFVQITILDNDNKKGVIEKINERHNQLIRPSVSNVDQAIIVFSVICPDPHLSLLDRFLVLTESQGLETIICLNKIDLVKAELYKEIIDIYTLAGYEIVLTSKNHEKGLEELKNKLEDKTSVFAGPSGVGKSTLLNHIYPGFELKTGEVSSKIGRGKHTTRHAELLPIGNSGWVVDTPGFSSLNMEFEEEDVSHYFIEFANYAENCRFNSCMHLNEPNCGVKEAIKNNEIHSSRYNSYVQIIDEIRKNRRY